jgi:hypothetical protein
MLYLFILADGDNIYMEFIMAGDYLLDAQNNFGKSTMYVESLKAIRGQQTTKKNISRDVILQEACEVASCSYERNTNWGNEVRT